MPNPKSIAYPAAFGNFIWGMLIVLLIAGCNHTGRESFPGCVNGVSCPYSDLCYSASTVCGADGYTHCVADARLRSCPAQPPRDCVQGVACDTGNPCTRGSVVCGADGRSHCVVDTVETVPGCG